MTATADSPTQKNAPAPQIPGSARERLKRGRTLRQKDVETPGLGRFRLREILQNEIDEANELLAHRVADDKGNITTTFDNRGHRARLIAQTLINDDGSNVYAKDEIEEGTQEVGDKPKDVFDALWAGFDELNAWSKEEKDKLGKGSAKATS